MTQAQAGDGRDEDGGLHAQMAAFERLVRVEALSFTTVMDLVLSFTAMVHGFLNDCGRIDVANEALGRVGPFVTRGFECLHSPAGRAETTAVRVEAIALQRTLPVGSAGWLLYDLVILCLFDEESSEFETFGPEPAVEAIMTTVGDLAEGLCAVFVAHAAERLQRLAPEALRRQGVEPAGC